MKLLSLSRILLFIFCFFLLASVGVNTIMAEKIDLKNFQPEVYASDNSKYFQGIVNLVFVVAVSLVFFYLLYGALSWITSSGDANKLLTAKNRMIQAVIGMLILASVWAIYTFVVMVMTGSADLNKINIPSLK